MTKKELIKKLAKKNERDYIEIDTEFKKLKKVEIMLKAYELAHYNEITDFIDSVCDHNDDDEDDYLLDKEVIEEIVNYEGNFIKRVWKDWLDYNHPERYNFFCWEDLAEIISHTF